MMKFFSPKLITILTAILLLLGLVYEPTSVTTLRIMIVLLASWLAITVHELGHILFGKKAGYEFLFFTTGPISIERTKKGIKVIENKNWSTVGGVAMMMPPILKKEEMIKRSIIYTAGGPVLSLIFALLGLSVHYILAIPFSLFFAFLNTGIFLVTIIPTKGGMGSDGYIIKSLFKKNSDSYKLIENMIMNKELFSKKNPLEWDNEYIELAKQKTPSIENLLSGTMVYYYEIEKNGFFSAKAAIDGYCSIPLTKTNSFQLGPFLHIQQLEHFLYDTPNLEKIVYYQQYLTTLEPVSYHRGKAMIAYIENNIPKALEHISKVLKVVEEGERMYGFFKAERTLTKLVEEKIVKHPNNSSSPTG